MVKFQNFFTVLETSGVHSICFDYLFPEGKYGKRVEYHQKSMTKKFPDYFILSKFNNLSFHGYRKNASRSPFRV